MSGRQRPRREPEQGRGQRHRVSRGVHARGPCSVFRGVTEGRGPESGAQEGPAAPGQGRRSSAGRGVSGSIGAPSPAGRGGHHEGLAFM